MESDVMLYVVGSAEENEVLLYRYGRMPLDYTTQGGSQLTRCSVVLALRDSLNILLKSVQCHLLPVLIQC